MKNLRGYFDILNKAEQHIDLYQNGRCSPTNALKMLARHSEGTIDPLY